MKKRKARIGDFIKWLEDGDVGVVINIEKYRMKVKWRDDGYNENHFADISSIKYRILSRDEYIMEML